MNQHEQIIVYEVFPLYLGMSREKERKITQADNEAITTNPTELAGDIRQKLPATQ